MLKFVLAVLALLIIGGAVWRVLVYEPKRAVAPQPKATIWEDTPSVTSPSSKPLTQAQRMELLESGPKENVIPARSGVSSADFSSFVPKRRSAFEMQPPSGHTISKPSTRSTTSVPGKRVVNTNFYSKDKAPLSSSSSQRGGGSFTGPNVSLGNTTQERMQQERSARMLAPYLRPNAKQKAQMDEQWKKLSAAIDRAVLQALAPKSKKAQMIEKYAPQGSSSSTAIDSLPPQQAESLGGFAPVVQAVNSQKQEIMKSFGSAFGSSVAQQAGGLMDAFSNELLSALSDPTASAEEKSQKAREISKKYQDKMNKLEEKSQYDKFVQDRIAQNNKQKEELGSLYPGQKEQIAQLCDQKLEKELALSTQNLPREEYYNQLAQDEQKFRSDVQKLALEGGQSVQEFRQWEQKKAREQLDALAQLEEEGKITSVAQPANPEERAQTNSEIETQKKAIVDGMVQTFGEETREEVESLMQNYEQIRKQIDDEPLSVLQRQTKKEEVIKQYNRQLAEMKIRLVEKMNIPEEQKQEILGNLRQEYNSIQ